MIEWLSWLPYKIGFINSNILETSKDKSSTPPSFKFLEQRVHELVGGPLVNNVVGSERLRSGGLNTKGVFFYPIPFLVVFF